MLTSPDRAQVQAAYVLTNTVRTAVSVDIRTLSEREALIVSTEPLDGERMLLLLDMSNQEQSLLECDVVHHSEYHNHWMGGREVTYVACRLRFRRKLATSELHQSLLAAFPTTRRPECDCPAVESQVESQQPQLMPLLSAIGILVVRVWGQTL